jgi:hypothetical protein
MYVPQSSWYRTTSSWYDRIVITFEEVDGKMVVLDCWRSEYRYPMIAFGGQLTHESRNCTNEAKFDWTFPPY